MTDNVHAPVGAGGYGILLVLAYGARYKSQLYFVASSNTNTVWCRVYDEGTWRNWIRLA